MLRRADGGPRTATSGVPVNGGALALAARLFLCGAGAAPQM
jgi:hypothetical protein